MRALHRLRTTAVLLAVALGLSACASGAEGDAAEELSISVPSEPNSFQVGAWAGGDAVTYLSFYDTIFMRTPEGEFVGSIAETWEYDEERTELTLNIRPDMTFTDGTPVDAEAVAASLEFARSGPATASNLDTVDSIEAQDDGTVLVRLTTPDASIVPALAGVVGVVSSLEALEAEESILVPVGSGPYYLDEAGSTAGSVYSMRKNHDHWNADAYPFETVEVRVITDAAAVQNAVLSGQLDFGSITPDAQSQFGPDQFAVGSYAPLAIAGIWIADREGDVVPELADARVRQAISLVFDREQIETNLNPGTLNATNQIFNAAGDVFDPALLEGSFDVDRARQLMDDAGYADGFSVTMPSSVVTTQYEAVITSSLAQIGVDVSWEAVPFQNYYAQILAQNYGMFVGVYGLTGSDPQDVKRMTSGIFNPFNLSSPEFRDLMAAAGSAPDDELAQRLSAVNTYFLDEVWIAPFSYLTGMWAAANHIEYTPMTGTANGVRPFAPATD